MFAAGGLRFLSRLPVATFVVATVRSGVEVVGIVLWFVLRFLVVIDALTEGKVTFELKRLCHEQLGGSRERGEGFRFPFSPILRMSQ